MQASDKRPARSGAYRQHRDAVIERDGWFCQICFLPVSSSLAPHDDWAFSIDHEIPVAEGGGDDLHNLRAAHRWCNDARVLSDEWQVACAARYRLGVTGQ